MQKAEIENNEQNETNEAKIAQLEGELATARMEANKAHAHLEEKGDDHASIDKYENELIYMVDLLT